MPVNDPTAMPSNWLNAPLAIVGMDCRLPGADGLKAYWQLLHNGGYPIERMSDVQLDRRWYYDPHKGKRGKTYTDVGGFVAPRELDWSLLNLSPEDAQHWDECHLNFCEVAARACRDAGYDPRRLSQRNAGVFVGHSGGSTLGGELAYRTLLEDYVNLLDQIPQWAELDSTAAKQRLHTLLVQQRPRRVDGKPWVEAGFAAGLVSRALGLTGPHMSIDAACASSLVALALGAMSIHSGQTEMAIIGGASFNKTDSLILFSHAQSCSASVSRPFDEQADGLISSEGYVALVIKSLGRAQADGDRIHAVLHGIGISTDGRGKSLWAPRKEGQFLAIERAYSSEVPPSSVQMVEAHATSTHLGDATEMEALAAFYGPHVPPGQPLAVGSVKSNIGHTLETAGLAGIVKSVLAIQHAIIPPSINVQQLSQTIPWSEIPLRVVQSPTAWPALPADQPRRASVNAFGIGGLNVHVVVEQFLEPPTITPPSRSISAAPAANGAMRKATFEPIAVIGRGLVVPGGLDVASFQHSLRSLMRVGDLSGKGASAVARFPERCAKVSDFHYNWRRHKVPPKQIAQANPLQFMLLDAAEQALREAGLLERDFDRRHTAVVVGSVFGGDFGNELFAGLRLPEFRERLLQTLSELAVLPEHALHLADEYETQFLKSFPALLDETGSFTSSTLASRLSKTFDLMGGALAIDAGDVSSFAALSSACQLLHSGTVKLVLCAAAQRAQDRSAFEIIEQSGRLAQTGSSANSYALGEGVALVLLKPLCDAVRDGDHVWATIEDLGVGFDADSLEKSLALATGRIRHQCDVVAFHGGVAIESLDRLAEQALGQMSHQPLRSASSLPLTGHLQAAQGLVDLIEISCEPRPGRQLLVSHTQSGQSYVVAATSARSTASSPEVLPIATAIKQPRATASDSRSAQSRAEERQTKLTEVSTWGATRDSAARAKTYFFAAATLEQLKEQLSRQAITQNQFLTVGGSPVSSRQSWRAAVVGTPDELASKAQKLSLLIGNEKSMASAAEQGLLWRAPIDDRTTPPKIAWLFPGQGSQYSGMLRELCGKDAVAATALQQANSVLARYGQVSFEQLAWAADNDLGGNVWHTQAAMLIANWIMLRSLQSRGVSADRYSGHSFGEFSAMLAAGCWDLEGALQATWERCRAIVEYVPAGCAMLSIQSSAARVEQEIQASQLPLSISHRNAPNQTVVGGKQAHVTHLAQRLEEEGIASRVLPVPTAFHTAALTAAERPFRAALESLDIQPPRTPLLSSVNNQFVAEPSLMRDGLAAQLTTPLDFVSLIERLVADGITFVFEVGPQQVLTRLVRQTTDRLTILPTDHAKLGASYQLDIAAAAAELYGLVPMTSLSVQRAQGGLHALGNGRVMQDASSIIEFDATQVRKTRLRSDSRSGRSSKKHASLASYTPLLPTHAPVHFDASASRPGRPAEDREVVDRSPPQPTERDARPAAAANAATASAAARTDTGDEAFRPAPPTVATAKSQIAIESFLIDFVVEQTGYPAEIIELDWDIEADLGIDSIKKAQLFGELREFFDLEMHASLRLDDFRSLRDIAALLNRTPGKADWLTAQEGMPGDGEAQTTTQTPPATASPNLMSPNDSSPQKLSSERVPPSAQSAAGKQVELTAFLIDFVVEQTGYPAEIVELDADLEADLGIDSIKKAQLFGELRELFGIESAHLAATPQGKSSERPLALGDLRTLRQILDVLLAHPTASPSNSNAVAAPAASMMAGSQGASPQFAAQSSPESPVSAVALSSCGPLPPLMPPAIDSRHASIPRHTAGIPSLDVAQATPLTSRDFARAVSTNLHAMVGRRDGLVLTEPPSNGQWSDYQARSTRLADLCGVHRSSLQAFDRSLLGKAQWQRLSGSPPRPVANGGLADGSVHWLVALEVPTWLLTAGAPLGLTLNAQGQQEIDLPGSLNPLAVLDGTTLRVAGLLPAASPTAARDLSTALLGLRGQSIDELVSETRQWGLTHDWWLVLADVRARKLVSAESCGGVIALRKESLDELQATHSAVTAMSPRGARAWLGIDCQTLQFVVRLQQRPHPSLPIQELLPIRNRVPARLDSEPRSTLRSPAVNEHQTAGTESKSEEPSSGEPLQFDAAPSIANRYVLRMVPAPQREAGGRQPEWAGTALVIGDNPVARELESRLQAAGVEVVRWHASDDVRELVDKFQILSADRTVPHLFLMTACDSDAQFTLDETAWHSRRKRGLLGNFWLCQKWLEHIASQDLMDDASLLAVSTLGGDFGIGGQIASAEGGGVSGLLKSILIECWMQGHRTLPIKTIDTAVRQSPVEIVDAVWSELAIPSYDNEIAVIAGTRHVLRAVLSPLPSRPKLAVPPTPASSRPVASVTRGGTWICTGGARGITAYVAERLAQRYDLTLHLLGTAPHPRIDPAWLELGEVGLRQLKMHVMTEARTAGQNPVKAWQETEKAIEIDNTLRRLAMQGIKAFYHSCNVSDRVALRQVLHAVRQRSGPIHGVLHGAGVGRDSRFDRKQPERVEQCISAKVDGALSLMAATQGDPLEHFIGFGSISGRFGANGHTDYSAANDMLCKTIDGFRSLRPEVNAIAFHWHAWGDVGMATKPETRLALEMIDMQFMPAAEGFQHLVAELEGGAGESEVLITDDRYYRMFYPAETLATVESERSKPVHQGQPLVQPAAAVGTCNQSADDASGDRRCFVAAVDPSKDPFLTNHRLDGRPLMPFVVAAEMLLEAGRTHLASDACVLQNIEAISGLRFFNESPRELHIETTALGPRRVECRLYSDFVARDGRLVEAKRLNFSAQVAAPTMSDEIALSASTHIVLPSDAICQRAVYPEADSKFSVGWPLQRLRKFWMVERGIVGRISAPALIELAGIGRDVRGWRIPSAALDACLYAVGVLAWQQVAVGSALPVRIGRLALGRLPSPGEACQVHARLREAGEGAATFDFTLYGVDGNVVLDAVGYEVAWLASNRPVQPVVRDRRGSDRSEERG